MEKALYATLITQYISEIQSLAYKLDKLDNQIDIRFPFYSIMDAVLHLEDAESILKNIVKDLNYKDLKDEEYEYID